jgi:hypothetical protein
MGECSGYSGWQRSSGQAFETGEATGLIDFRFWQLDLHRQIH